MLQGNAINSSDEEDGAGEQLDNAAGPGVAGGKNLKNTTVMHFKRQYKSSAAMQMKRRRAGRFGRQAGYEDDEDSFSSDEDSDEEDDDGGMAMDDEFYRYDHNRVRVKGRYDIEGQFIVVMADRDVRGRCDVAGYMLDMQGQRIRDEEMADRMR